VVPMTILGGAIPIATLGDQGKVNVTNVQYILSCFVSAARMRVDRVKCDS
jgi:hypothetical protein